jgi:hypothetical protein
MRYFTVFLVSFMSFFLTAAAFPGTGDGLLVGFKGGVNFSVVIPTKRFAVIQSLGGTGTSPAEKKYGPFFRNTGYQYGFLGMMRVRNSFLVSIEPGFGSYVMKYQAISTWYNASTQSNRIEITSNFTDKLRYFEIPLELRYELGTGMVRPFLAAGFVYGMLTGATGKAQSSTVQYINDAGYNLENNTLAGDISGNYITTRLSTFPGAGLFVEMSRIILFAEADYYFTLHNIVDESARYSNQQTVGSSYNVPDNLKLDNLVINIGVLFRINTPAGSQGKGRGKGSAVECPPINNRKH